MITSPALQMRIENSQTPKTNTQKQTNNLSSKSDTVEISTKANKNYKKYITIGAISATAIAGAFFLAAKGKTCLIKLNAKKAQKYAENVESKAEKLKEEVLELFNNNGIKEGNKIAKITTQKDGTKLMEELTSNNEAIRKSTFVDEVLSSIELSTKKETSCFYEFSKDGKLSRYMKDIKTFEDGNIKTAKCLLFENGKLSHYVKGIEEFTDNRYTTAKVLYYKDGNLVSSVKNCEYIDDRYKAREILEFENGKLTNHLKNYEGITCNAPEDKFIDEFDD